MSGEIHLREESVELDKLLEQNKELGELAEKHHLLRRMLVFWGLFPIVTTISLVGGLILASTGAIGSPNNAPLNLDLSTLEKVNSDIFVATLTLAGLIIGIIPLLSFFFLGEKKDDWVEIKNSLKNRKKAKSAKIKEALEAQECLLYVILANTKKAIKKYTQIAVTFSILGLLFSVFGYFVFGVQNAVNYGTSTMWNNLAINLVLNLLLLVAIIAEVFPLASLALYDSGYKIIKLYDEKGKECTLFSPD